MSKEIKTLDWLFLNIRKLDLKSPAVIDSFRRIGDWLSSEGKVEDEYVQNQLKFLELIMSNEFIWD